MSPLGSDDEVLFATAPRSDFWEKLDAWRNQMGSFNKRKFVDGNQYPDIQDVVSSNKRFNTKQLTNSVRVLPGEVDPDEYDPRPRPLGQQYMSY